MVECARVAGWPKIDELRGKFIVNIIGNWSTAAYDWVQYATSDLRERIAFPMQTVLEAAPNVIIVTGGDGDVALPRPWFPVKVDGICFFVNDIDERANPCPDIDLASRQAAF